MAKAKPKVSGDPDFRFAIVTQAIEKTVKTAILAGMVVLCVYYGIYKPIEVARGETTSINYVVDFLADIKANIWIAYGAGGAGVLYGRMMRKKLLKERAEKDARIRELESRIDPGVTSSGLDVEGEKKRKGP